MESNLPELLRRAEGADPAAADELFALLYDELRRLADSHLRRGNAALTLGTTTLVHEAYLSMSGNTHASFPDRARFFAYASRAMRGLMIDYARRHYAKKRGRQFEVTLEEHDGNLPEVRAAATDLPALGEAMAELSELDPALTELVDLHFFGGFSFTEIATMRGVSDRTIQREWRKARLLLHRVLSRTTTESSAGEMI
ncbi:MAG TPA: ECF-type sigma factor [Gemmatimonadales bacterium]|nr:ECF-type sigma factor [Gemmatimonadales bacterium]